jgi:hypothetical protein
VVPHLTPVLLKQLTRQEETPEVDDTAWNMAMAAGTCLGLMARVAKDALTPHVLPFVQENIAKAAAPEDWRFREAATFAFGSILEGPDPTSLIEVVRQAMDFLLRVRRGGWAREAGLGGLEGVAVAAHVITMLLYGEGGACCEEHGNAHITCWSALAL